MKRDKLLYEIVLDMLAFALAADDQTLYDACAGVSATCQFYTS